MKSNFKKFSVAIAAIMTIGTVTLVSCDKENDIVNSEIADGSRTEVASTKDSHIKYTFYDQHGRKWTVEGTIDIHYFKETVDYDVVLTDPDGNRYHFSGTISFATGGNGQINGTLTDMDGKIIVIDDYFSEALFTLTAELLNK